MREMTITGKLVGQFVIVGHQGGDAVKSGLLAIRLVIDINDSRLSMINSLIIVISIERSLPRDPTPLIAYLTSA